MIEILHVCGHAHVSPDIDCKCASLIDKFSNQADPGA